MHYLRHWRSWLLAAVTALLLVTQGRALLAHGANNRGGLALNMALLAPGLDSAARHTAQVAAGQSFHQALRIKPDAAAPYYNLGTLYTLWNDLPAAAEAFRHARTLAPGDALAAFQHGQVLAVLGQEVEARIAWREAGAGPYLSQRAEALQNAGKYEDALRYAERAVAVAPDLIDSYVVQGRVLTRQEHYEEALAAYEIAAAQAPADPLIARLRAQLLSRHLAREAEAVAVLTEALAVADDDTLPRLELGRIYHTRGDCPAAETLLMPLMDAPASVSVQAQALGIVGQCYVNAGTIATGLPYLMQAVTLQPTSVGYAWQLAEAYEAAGEVAAARAAYRRVLELQPDHGQAQDALERLEAAP